MNSTAVASLMQASSPAPQMREPAMATSGRSRLPPAEIRWSASAGMVGAELAMRSVIRASTAAMSGAASRTRGSTSPLGRSRMAVAVLKTGAPRSAGPMAATMSRRQAGVKARQTRIGPGQDRVMQTDHPVTQASPEGFTEDRILGGRVTLLQPRHGYRAGLDAALLAAAC